MQLDLGYVFVVYIVMAALIAVVATKWRALAQSLQDFRSKDWPTLSATVDLVDVMAQSEGPRGQGTSYLAMLTYVYHNPALQTGDYSRKFFDKDEAETWANSYKGSSVTVHVDPKDPARSVLQKKDL